METPSSLGPQLPFTSARSGNATRTMTTPNPKNPKPKSHQKDADQTKVLAGSKRKREGKTQYGRQATSQALEPLGEEVAPLSLTVHNDGDEIYDDSDNEGEEEDDDDGSEEVEELGISIETRFRLIKNNSATTEYAHLDEDDGTRVAGNLQYLEDTAHDVSPYQLRAYTYQGIKPTNGFSCSWAYLTNSARHQIPFLTWHQTPLATLRDMCAHHLLWDDRVQDEYLSWTSSLLFAIVHALNRRDKGQRPPMIAGGKTSSLQTPEGEPVPMYPANDWHGVVDVLGKDWQAMCKNKLHTKKFNHEALSWGQLRDPKRAVQHVELDTLIRNGLLELLPEVMGNIGRPHIRERSGLWEALVALRRQLFTKATERPILDEEIKIADGLAALSKRHVSKEDFELAERLGSEYKIDLTKEEIKEDEKARPPFFMFVQFLSLRERPAKNENFRDWVRNNYTAEDVQEVKYRSLHKVPDNLQDVGQYVNLVRESCLALNIETIPDTELIHDNGHDDMLRLQRYLADGNYAARLWRVRRYIPKGRIFKENIYGMDEASRHERRAIALELTRERAFYRGITVPTDQDLGIMYQENLITVATQSEAAKIRTRKWCEALDRIVARNKAEKVAAEKKEKEETNSSPRVAQKSISFKLKESATFESIYEDNRLKMERFAGQIRRREQSRLEIHDHDQQFLKINSELVASMETTLETQTRHKKAYDRTWKEFFLPFFPPQQDCSDDHESTFRADSVVSTVSTQLVAETLFISRSTEQLEPPGILTSVPPPALAPESDAPETSAPAPQQLLAIEDSSAANSVTIVDIIGVAEATLAAQRVLETA